MRSAVSILNKFGYVGAMVAMVLLILAYHPVSSIFSTAAPNECSAKGGFISGTNNNPIFSFGSTFTPNQTEVFAANVPAGTYDINWQSYDPHSIYGGRNQQQEKWFFVGFKDGKQVFNGSSSGLITADVPEDSDISTGTFASVQLPALDSVQFIHADSVGATAESVRPVCLGFEDVTPPPVIVDCTLPAANGLAINSDKTLLIRTGPIQTRAYAATLAAGNYSINWQSFDSHSVKGGQNQYNETWKVVGLKNGTVVYTSPITTDIAENADLAAGTFANQNIPMVDSVIFQHSQQGTTPESVTPVCVNFTKNQTPVVTCTGLTKLALGNDRYKFTASASASGGATISDYTINFGDGTSATTASGAIEHTYSTPGTFTVQAFVNSSIGTKTSAACKTTVLVEAPDPIVDLSLKKYVSVDGAEFVDANTADAAAKATTEDTVVWRIVVKNAGPDNATGVTVNDVVPSQFSVSDFSATTGTYTNNIWSITDVAANGTRTAEVTTTATTAGSYVNWAEVFTQNETDKDSTPGDGADGNQDDEDPAYIIVSEPAPENASLGDRVWLDRNENGIQDTGEPSVAGAVVILLNEADQEVSQTTTNGNGIYSFTNLTPGTYKVKFVAPNSYVFTTSDAGTNDLIDSDANTTSGITQNIVLEPGENNTSVDAGIIEQILPASLGDRVWLDLNEDGVQNGGEPSLANVSVELLRNNGTKITETTTNQNGLYSFSNLTPATYRVRFIAPNGYDFTKANIGSDLTDSDAGVVDGLSPSVSLTSGENNLTVDAGLIEIKQPVFNCDSIERVKLSNGDYKYTADVTIENTTFTEYVFTLFNEVGVASITSSTPTATFAASAFTTGANVVAAQVVTAAGTSAINECQDTLTREPIIDLHLTKTVNKSAVSVGDSVVWQITVGNDGPDTATGVVVSDLAPAGLSFVTYATATGNFDANTAVWTIGTLEADKTVTLNLVTTVNEAGTFVNFAGVTAANEKDIDSTPTDAIDGNEDDEDSAQVVADPAPVVSCNSMSVVKLSRTSFEFSVDTTAQNGATVNSYEFSVNGVKAQSSPVNTFSFNQAITGEYVISADVIFDINEEQITKSCEQIAVTVADEPSSPSFECVALNVIKLGDNKYRLDASTYADNGAELSNIEFVVNGKVVKSSTDNTMEITINQPGTYTMNATATFMVDDAEKSDTCPEATITIAQPGQVLGTFTPPAKELPSTGADGFLATLTAGMFALGAYTFAAKQRQVSKKTKR